MMPGISVKVALALLSLLIPASLIAQSAQAPPPVPGTPAHSNFSGRWRMVKDKSDFGGFPVPDAIIRVIDQHDPTLNIHTIETINGKTTTADVTYYTDGGEAKNFLNGHNAISKTFWDGGALMVRTNMQDPQGNPIVMVERYELSPDGKTLTTTSDISTVKGGASLKLVCEK